MPEPLNSVPGDLEAGLLNIIRVCPREFRPESTSVMCCRCAGTAKGRWWCGMQDSVVWVHDLTETRLKCPLVTTEPNCRATRGLLWWDGTRVCTVIHFSLCRVWLLSPRVLHCCMYVIFCCYMPEGRSAVEFTLVTLSSSLCKDIIAV